MNKLQMAHEYAIALINSDCEMQFDKFIRLCWNYADAMQAEADKREVSIEEAMKDHVHDYIYGRVCAYGKVKDVEEEWQPDWSQAPMGFNRFVVGSDGGYGFFTNMEPQLQDDFWFVGADGIVIKDHGYQGNWQDSLRKRPQ